MNLIPLGVQGGNFVDPTTANPNTKVICPHCNGELKLVKGVVLTNHFKHSSSKVSESCNYSFGLTSREAFLALLEDTCRHRKKSLPLRLPQYKFEHGFINHQIIRESIITIDELSIDMSGSLGYDFVMLNGSEKIGVWLSWEGREQSASSDLKSGISAELCINLEELYQKLINSKPQVRATSFLTMLVGHITLDAQRHWLRHIVGEDKARNLKEDGVMAAPMTKPSSISKNEPVASHCVICKGDKGQKALLNNNVCFKCVEKTFYAKGVFRYHQMMAILEEKYLKEYTAW